MTNWIVTICRNGIDLTKAAVKSFLAQDVGNVEVLLIDNGTEDGTRELMRAYENVRLMTMQNASVAECWNAALDWIFRVNNTHALVCNNDVVLRPDTYRWLLEDGGIFGEFVTAVGNADPNCVSPPYATPSGKIRPHPDFSCFLIEYVCWKEVGRFDENFKGAYGEDADYHVRMHRAGIHAHCIDLPFYHVASGTLKNSTDEERFRICQQADANRAYFKRKYGVEIGSPEYYALFTSAVQESAESSCASE